MGRITPSRTIPRYFEIFQSGNYEGRGVATTTPRRPAMLKWIMPQQCDNASITSGLRQTNVMSLPSPPGGVCFGKLHSNRCTPFLAGSNPLLMRLSTPSPSLSPLALPCLRPSPPSPLAEIFSDILLRIPVHLFPQPTRRSSPDRLSDRISDRISDKYSGMIGGVQCTQVL